VAGLQYPRIAAVFGLVYIFTRYFYFKGYSSGDPRKRMAGVGAYYKIGLFGLLGCSIGFALHQFFPALV
jgi:glutathione S-transferase